MSRGRQRGENVVIPLTKKCKNVFTFYILVTFFLLFNVFYCPNVFKNNKMLSYRRETALQGALQFSPKVEDWNWETIFYGHCRSIFNHNRPENLSNSVKKKTQNKSYYGVQGHSRSSRSVPIESPYAIYY